MDWKGKAKASWGAWGHWNNFKELLDLLGWKDWIRGWIIGVLPLAFGGGGVLGLFGGAITIGSPIGVLWAALATAALVSIVSFFLSLSRALARISSNKVIGKEPLLTALAAVEARPKTLMEYFKSDFPNTLKAFVDISINVKGITHSNILMQAYWDFESHSSFVGYFIPMSGDTPRIATALSDFPEKTLEHFKNQLEVESHNPGDNQGTAMRGLTFTKAVYIYHEQSLDIQQIAALDNLYKNKGLSLLLRGSSYSSTRWLQEAASKSKLK